jgi:molecular chaperone GrpE
MNDTDQKPLDGAQNPVSEAPAADTPSEAEVWKDRALRALADIDNLRKRHARELDDARKYAATTFARDILPVADNLERALDAAKKDAKAAEMKVLIDGVALVLATLHSSFQKAGIERVATVGQKLNPDVHQVMMEVPSAEAEPGTVVQEIQAGYTLSGRLLRPALVGTAKAVS